MPASSIADQEGVRAWRHLSADFVEVFIHRLGIGRRHDDGGADTEVRANRANR
jgi:hypothetical protein